MVKKLENKKKIQFILLLFFFGICLGNLVSADDSCSLDISLINQDPYPSIPNEYVDIVLQVSGVQNVNCEGAWIELLPSYPFSLDGDTSLRILEGSTWTFNYKNEWMINYRLRVDKDALDGNYNLEIRYAPGNSNLESYFYKEINITVQDSRTNFDAVIQESTNSEVSIAIANTGKYTANSVVVRIPEQNGFKVTGTDGQMVGNLDSGDYTIVGFSLIANTQKNFQNQTTKLKFDIYYTDALGERRIVNIELPLQMTSNMTAEGIIPGNFPNKMGNNSSSWSNWYLLAIILIIFGGIFLIHKKYSMQIKKIYNKSKQRIKEFLSKKEKKDHSKEIIPTWVKNSKEKEKNKTIRK